MRAVKGRLNDARSLARIPLLSPDLHCVLAALFCTSFRTRAAVIKVTSAAEARPVAIGTVSSPHSVREVVVAEVPSHPAHRLSCLFVFTGLFLLAFLVVRAIITLLCCGRPARTVVIVPPEEARVKAVGAPPLLISEITTKPVQVAEPLAKA